MTERDLDERLRSWYRDSVGEDEGAPLELRERLAAIPVAARSRSRPVLNHRHLRLLAAAAVLFVGGGIAAGSELLRRSALVGPGPSNAVVVAASPTSSMTATPTRTPTPAPLAALGPGFTWSGATSTRRIAPYGETATLLPDGRVLVADACGTAAELFDASADSFSPTGSSTSRRGYATTTLLRDGRVLVVGGVECPNAEDHGIWASAELYDPATGTFTATGSMSVPREFHTATLLADGRVLIAGGYSGPEAVATGGITLASVKTAETSTSILSSAEIYDPATGTFSRTGSMTTFRDHHTATLLKDGRVLLTGGGGEAYASSTSADVYDPVTGRFTATGAMRTGRWLHTATLLADGRVLVVGGRSPKDSVYDSAEVFDPTSGKFRAAGTMGEGRQQHTATLLDDGRVLITGGYWSDGQGSRVLSSAEMYDPGSRTFRTIGSMGLPRMEHTAIMLPDGRVAIIGGSDIGDVGAVNVGSMVIYKP